MMSKDALVEKSASIAQEQEVADLNYEIACRLTNQDRTAKDLLPYAPLSGRDTLNDVVYDWLAIDRAADLFQLSINGSDLRDTSFDGFPPVLKDYILKQASARAFEQQYGIEKLIEARVRQLEGLIKRNELENLYKAGYMLLLSGSNDVVNVYRSIMDHYHDGENTLKTLLFRGTLRSRYNSNAALIHIDITGPSRGGKDKVTSRFLCFLPPEDFTHYSSTSSKAAYYAVLEPITDDKGKVIGLEENPDYYAGLTVVIAEVADTGGFTALKALAEEDQYSQRRHQTIVNGVYQTYSILGPRCVVILSVRGIQESETQEVLNRFIQGPLERRNENSKLDRNLKLLENLNGGVDVRDDPRVKYVRAAREILNLNCFDVTFEAPSYEAQTLLEGLVKFFTAAGFNPTQISQFYSLGECAAFQKRFFRGNPEVCRVEVDDVLEAWHLVNHFAKETIAKLTAAELEIFNAVYPLTDEELYDLGLDSASGDGAYSDLLRAPTQADIVRRGFKKGTVSKALTTKEPGGKLLNSDLVYNEHSQLRNTAVYRRTQHGDDLNAEIMTSVVVDSRTYTPLDPTLNGVSEVSQGFQNIWEDKDDEEAFISRLAGNYDKIRLEFPSFQYRERDNEGREDLLSSYMLDRNQETWRSCAQKDDNDDLSANKPIFDDIEVSENSGSARNLGNQAAMRNCIVRALTECKSAFKSHKLAVTLLNLRDYICEQVYSTYNFSAWSIDNITEFYDKLAESDKQIQSLIIDYMRVETSELHTSTIY